MKVISRNLENVRRRSNAVVYIQAVDPRFEGQSERVGVVEVGEMEIVGN